MNRSSLQFLAVLKEPMIASISSVFFRAAVLAAVTSLALPARLSAQDAVPSEILVRRVGESSSCHSEQLRGRPPSPGVVSRTIVDFGEVSVDSRFAWAFLDTAGAIRIASVQWAPLSPSNSIDAFSILVTTRPDGQKVGLVRRSPLRRRGDIAIVDSAREASTIEIDSVTVRRTLEFTDWLIKRVCRTGNPR